MANVTIQYTADIQQLNAKLDLIIQKQDQLASSAKKASDDMVSSNKKAAESLDPLANQLNKIGGMIVAAFSIDKIIEFSKSVIDTERKLELLQNRLNFVAGSTADGEKLFKRLVSTSKNLGINIEVLAEGMAAFGISATQAGFSAAKAEQIFLKMSAGLRAAGATSLQSQRAFFALQQMIDKGVVSAEELRRQLAEALPGATSLMVKAYNNLNPKQQVTMDQFIKLQEAGKILSREILPEFANVIEKEFAPALAGKKESLDAALDRVNTQFTLLKSNLANSAFIKTVASTISTELERVNSILNSNFTAMEKAGMVLNLFTSSRSASVIVANEFIKTEEQIVKVQEEINKEGIANAKRISLLKGEEKKQALDELSRQKLILEGMVKAGTATKEQIRSFERIKATQQELFDLEVQSAANSKTSEEERKKAREQRLKDEVALAKIRVEQSEKGSIEENNARANLAQKQGDLDVFMAKSSAEMQLARVVAEI
jgi:tape measure domain-containing protein